MAIRKISAIAASNEDAYGGVVSGQGLSYLKELGIDGVGHRRWTPRFRQTESRVSVSVIGVVAAGRVELAWGAQRTALTRGHVYLVPAGCTAAWRQEGKSASSVWVTYSPGPSNPLAALGGPASCGGGIALVACVAELCREYYGRARPGLLARWAGVVDAVARGLAETAGSHGDLENLWQHVAAEPARRWRVAELARMLGVTRQHFCSLCRAQLGRSPMQELLRLRMEHAAALLTATDVPVARVAPQVGYDDPFVFSRAFKTHFARSPLLFRRDHR
ncbi:MAG: AraC family transcriptional regulator [Planctomycetaceae bacterium]|nr:AraC family transcriptional regulator [Planctomycetaceae bacterium]